MTKHLINYANAEFYIVEWHVHLCELFQVVMVSLHKDGSERRLYAFSLLFFVCYGVLLNTSAIVYNCFSAVIIGL